MFKLLVNENVWFNVPLHNMIKLAKMNIFKLSSSKEPSCSKCAYLEEKMFKLLVNDKCKMVQCSLAYMIKLALCDI